MLRSPHLVKSHLDSMPMFWQLQLSAVVLLRAVLAFCREIMKRELKEIQKKFNSTMIFITHEQEEAFYLADRVMIMSEGNIEQIDTPDNIYKNPKNQYIKDFVIAHLEQKYESLLKCTGRLKDEK